MSWHVEPRLLEAYAEGAVDETSSFSVEAHLLACASCRAEIARQRHVDRERLEGIWAEVQEVIDAPRRTPIERLLVFFGVPDDRARLLAATPSLTVSWFAAAALALGFAVLAAHGGEVVLEVAGGRAVYRYGDLFAHDASGTPLPARRCRPTPQPKQGCPRGEGPGRAAS
jgi:anti-sigma factor RsiW